MFHIRKSIFIDNVTSAITSYPFQAKTLSISSSKKKSMSARKLRDT